jgi:hypothetical protein
MDAIIAFIQPRNILSFFENKSIAQQIGIQVSCSDKTLLKLIDEYNYAKHTKGWI